MRRCEAHSEHVWVRTVVGLRASRIPGGWMGVIGTSQNRRMAMRSLRDPHIVLGETVLINEKNRHR